MKVPAFKMHTYHPTLLSCALLVVAAPAALAGKPQPKPKAPAHQETEPSKVRPHRGMTKAQVRKLYGHPDNQQVTSRGETWSYFFNAGHYWIPYYFGKPRTGAFHFNEAGILTDFEYNHED
jgi:outer membrane protein assembly factor BamE (lipoprotein component of BamABCDE complex)